MEKLELKNNNKSVNEIIKNPAKYGSSSLGNQKEFVKRAYKGLINPYISERKELGRKISLGRNVIGFSQEALGDLIGKSREYINKIEKCKADPSIKDLYKIYYYLKINPKIFFISKEDADFHNKNFNINFSNCVQFDNDDLEFIRDSLQSFESKNLRTAYKRLNNYYNKLFNKHSELKKNEWTAKVGAVVGFYIGMKEKYFTIGAYLSIKYFNESYK